MQHVWHHRLILKRHWIFNIDKNFNTATNKSAQLDFPLSKQGLSDCLAYTQTKIDMTEDSYGLLKIVYNKETSIGADIRFSRAELNELINSARELVESSDLIYADDILPLQQEIISAFNCYAAEINMAQMLYKQARSKSHNNTPT